MGRYKVCERCGSNLDYGETCDCKQGEQTTGRKHDWKMDPMSKFEKSNKVKRYAN